MITCKLLTSVYLCNVPFIYFVMDSHLYLTLVNSLKLGSHGIPRIWLHLSIFSSRIYLKRNVHEASRSRFNKVPQPRFQLFSLWGLKEIFIPRFQFFNLDFIHVLEHHLAISISLQIIQTDKIINKWTIYICGTRSDSRTKKYFELP